MLVLSQQPQVITYQCKIKRVNVWNKFWHNLAQRAGSKTINVYSNGLRETAGVQHHGSTTRFHIKKSVPYIYTR